MNNEHLEDDELSEEDLKDFAPSQWALDAGLMVVVNGETRITQKGLAALRAMLEAEKSGGKPN